MIGTEQDRTPAELRRDQLAALGRVAGELMHDLSNLTATLKGWAVIALGDARAGRLPLTELERLSEVSDEIGRMMRDVLETLQGAALSPEVTFDPVTVAERVIRRFLDSAPPLSLELVNPLTSGTRVAGRASFLSRALANLLGNAGRHARGEIRVAFATRDVQNQRWLVLSIEDDGPGIPGDQIDAIFEPLVSDAPGGTGLGLSSVAWAAHNLGGTVHYRTSMDLGGACFEIRLPIAGSASSLLAGDAAPRLDIPYRVLLLEDDADSRSVLLRVLKRVGVEPVVPAVGERGMEELLREVLASMPDIILVSVEMGARNGVAVWKMLQAHVPALAGRVIFLSGLVPGDPEWEAARATGSPILAKPLDSKEIAAAIAAVMQRS